MTVNTLLCSSSYKNSFFCDRLRNNEIMKGNLLKSKTIASRMIDVLPRYSNPAYGRLQIISSKHNRLENCCIMV